MKKHVLTLSLFLFSLSTFGQELSFQQLPSWDLQQVDPLLTDEERINQALDNSGPVDRKTLDLVLRKNDTKQYRHMGPDTRLYFIEQRSYTDGRKDKPSFDLTPKPSPWGEGPPTVMGYTEKEVLDMVDDPHGAACSDDHNQGDMANRYCHASIVKGVDQLLQYTGVSKGIAALLGASTFIPKEYIFDKKPSMSDLVIADYQLINNERTRLEVTAFADGAIFFVIRKRF